MKKAGADVLIRPIAFVSLFCTDCRFSFTDTSADGFDRISRARWKSRVGVRAILIQYPQRLFDQALQRLQELRPARPVHDAMV